MTVIASHFVYHDDRLNFKKTAGITLGFLGVLFVNLNKGDLDTNFLLTGEGFLLIAAVVSTAASFLAKKLTGKLNALIVTAWQMLIGSLVLFFISSTGSSIRRLTFSPLSSLLLIYLAFISAAAFALWYTLIKYNSLGFITIYKFITPVTGVLLSAILLPNESINIIIISAMIMVSLAIIIINYEPRQFLKKEV